MCKQRNIENVDQIVCAIIAKYPHRKVEVQDSILSAAEIAALSAAVTDVWYYGIVTVGNSTTIDLNLWGGTPIKITEQNQIIELTSHFTIDGGGSSNCAFRGYMITITS